jgi:hypothetical protein
MMWTASLTAIPSGAKRTAAIHREIAESAFSSIAQPLAIEAGGHRDLRARRRCSAVVAGAPLHRP